MDNPENAADTSAPETTSAAPAPAPASETAPAPLPEESEVAQPAPAEEGAPAPDVAELVRAEVDKALAADREVFGAEIDALKGEIAKVADGIHAVLSSLTDTVSERFAAQDAAAAAAPAAGEQLESADLASVQAYIDGRIGPAMEIVDGIVGRLTKVEMSFKRLHL